VPTNRAATRQPSKPMRPFTVCGAVALSVSGFLATGCADGVRRSAEQPVEASHQAIAPAPPPEPSITLEEALTLRALVLADRFPALEERLAYHADSANLDSGYEQRYRARFDVFDVADTSLRSHLDAWVASDTASSIAHLARATHRIAAAGEARGEKWARETSAQQFEGMLEWQRLAINDIEAAHWIDSTNVLQYFLLLHVTMTRGDDDHAKGVLDAGLRQLPGSLLLRMRYMNTLRPRWGGSVEQMQQLADEADRVARINPRLRLLRGFLAYEAGETLSGAKQHLAAAAEFSKAIAYGDCWQFRMARADAFYFADKYAAAVEDYTAALAMRPAMVNALARRGASYDYMAWEGPEGPARDALIERGRKDVWAAAELDPADRVLKSVLADHEALIPASKAELMDLRP
jgi:tetratricopeptide (TPR) repeat protein